jgi:glycine cleavage system H protein
VVDEPGRRGEATMEFPTDVRYTRDHEWARAEGDRIRVGVTDYAQDALGDVVYVDLPEVGTQVSAGESLGEIESTKSVSDVMSPATGTVAERNPLLDDRPELVNAEPFAGGWLVVIQLADRSELEGLLDASAYEAFVRNVEGS